MHRRIGQAPTACDASAARACRLGRCLEVRPLRSWSVPARARQQPEWRAEQSAAGSWRSLESQSGAMWWSWAR
jgi:hypothetical protein